MSSDIRKPDGSGLVEEEEEMTCIVGLVERGTVYIGSDTAATDDYYSQFELPADEKVFPVGKFLIAICGGIRAGQLIHFKFTPPVYDPEMDPYEYMVSLFTEELRKVIHDSGASWKEDNMEWNETMFMIGFEGKLYMIDSSYQVLRNKLPYISMGAGSDIALGSMFTSKDLPPEERIKTALKASAKFNASVRAPFVVRSV